MSKGTCFRHFLYVFYFKSELEKNEKKKNENLNQTSSNYKIVKCTWKLTQIQIG